MLQQCSSSAHLRRPLVFRVGLWRALSDIKSRASVARALRSTLASCSLARLQIQRKASDEQQQATPTGERAAKAHLASLAARD